MDFAIVCRPSRCLGMSPRILQLAADRPTPVRETAAAVALVAGTATVLAAVADPVGVVARAAAAMARTIGCGYFRCVLGLTPCQFGGHLPACPQELSAQVKLLDAMSNPLVRF
jgi:hypothetical protein